MIFQLSLIVFLCLWSVAATAVALRKRPGPSCAACFELSELQQRHDALLRRHDLLQHAYDAAVAQIVELRRRPLIRQTWLGAPVGFFHFPN